MQYNTIQYNAIQYNTVSFHQKLRSINVIGLNIFNLINIINDKMVDKMHQ